MKCPNCQLDNPDDSKFCKECGTRIIPVEKVQPSLTKTMVPPIEELTRGTLFANRYEIIEGLGKGGMGSVYRAEDKKIKEEVALKLIKPEIAADKQTIERFSNELKISRKIRHKNVCGMYDLGEDGGTYYISMEFIPGEDLKALISRVRIDIGTAVKITKQVCEGLAEAHRLGVIHRDLKPANIMIDKNGNARIMDFGIARSLLAKGLTQAGMMIGTPEYMSPEQSDAVDVDQRSDIYSLGVILYEMLTGEIPGQRAKPKDPKSINTDIPDELSKVTLKCLEKKKDQRYKNTEELISELNKIAEPKEEKILTPQWKNSIAVLPFENMSGDSEQEYFCDGITEELINALTQIKDLRVIARTSSFVFKDKREDIREIGHKLNVETLLEGSVRKSGNRIRITAQLVDVKDGSHLWSDRFDREMEDIFAIQDEISLSIVDILRVKLLGEEKAGLLKRSTDNIDAYNFYLKGRYFWNRRTKAGLNRSLEFFQKSIDTDPEFALAYSGLATTYTLLSIYDYLPSEIAYQKAKENVLKALDIDNTISEAHTAMAWIKDYYEWDWMGAKREFEQAIALNASDADAHHKFAHSLTEMGHFDISIEAMNRALELEPLAIEINACLGMNLYLARRYEEAIEQLNRSIELDPNYYDSYGWLGMAYVQKERYQEAFDMLHKAERFPEISNRVIASQVYAHAASGNSSKAQEKLKQLMTIYEKESAEPYFITWAYAGLGQKDRAMDFLQKAFDARSLFMRLVIKVDPWLDTLHSDPRYVELIKKMGLMEPE